MGPQGEPICGQVHGVPLPALAATSGVRLRAPNPKNKNLHKGGFSFLFVFGSLNTQHRSVNKKHGWTSIPERSTTSTTLPQKGVLPTPLDMHPPPESCFLHMGDPCFYLQRLIESIKACGGSQYASLDFLAFSSLERFIAYRTNSCSLSARVNDPPFFGGGGPCLSADNIQYRSNNGGESPATATGIAG